MQMQSNNSVLNGLIQSSSKFLLASMVLSFLLMMVVQMFYYAGAFKGVVPSAGFAFGIGIAIGLFTQMARMSFGLAGAYEFAIGRYGSGAAGLIFSFCITLFESFEVRGIATEWSNGNGHLFETLHLLFQFLIWSGFCLELRLAMNVSSSGNDTKEAEAVVVAEEKPSTDIKRMDKMEQDLGVIIGLLDAASKKSPVFSHNGTTKKKASSRS